MSFIPQLLKIAIPIILQNFLSSLVNMLDTVMVGQLGSVDIVAVGLGNQIFFIMSIMLFGTVSGGSIFIAQYWGKKDLSGIHITVGITLILSFALSLVFFVMALFFTRVCLSIYTKDAAVIAKGSAYLKAVSPSYLFTGVGFAFAFAQRSTERVKLPLIATGISVVLNAALNYEFIFGITIGSAVLVKPFGIVEAAIATDIARVVEFSILVSVQYLKKYEVAAPLKKFFAIQANFIPRYLKITLPVFISETLWGLDTSLQSSIYAHAGTDIIASYNITSTISNLIWTFFIGCGNTTAIIIGKKIGQSLYEEAKILAKKITLFMTIMGAVLALLLIPLSFLLKYIYNVSDGVIKMAQTFLYMTIVLYPFCATNMSIVVGVCRSGGDTIFALFMDVGFLWLISLPLGFVAVSFWHLPYYLIFIILRSEDCLKCGLGLSANERQMAF